MFTQCKKIRNKLTKVLHYFKLQINKGSYFLIIYYFLNVKLKKSYFENFMHPKIN